MFGDTFLHTAQLVTASMSWGVMVAVLVIAAARQSRCGPARC